MEVPLKNVFDTLNDISKPSLHKDAHEVNNDDKPVEEVQVDSSAIGKVSSGSEKTSLKASNILSSLEIVAFSLSELEVVEVGSSNSNLVKTMDATKASNMISFNMNDDASTRQHTGPIILHNSTPILISNTGPMGLDLQDRHSFKDNTSVDVGTSNSNSLNNFSGKDDNSDNSFLPVPPCVTFGQVAEIIDEGHTSCGMLFGAIWFFIVLPFILSCTYRTKLRSKFGLPEFPAPDWIAHFFCEWCALCQEYRELQSRGLDPSIVGSTSNLSPLL
ncbi:hypothetical protein Q3G72_005792 [Acer saccharum]|nr:hypothetical protein Q3G72_005792 [Acer saccharum]